VGRFLWSDTMRILRNCGCAYPVYGNGAKLVFGIIAACVWRWLNENVPLRTPGEQGRRGTVAAMIVRLCLVTDLRQSDRAHSARCGFLMRYLSPSIARKALKRNASYLRSCYSCRPSITRRRRSFLWLAISSIRTNDGAVLQASGSSSSKAQLLLCLGTDRQVRRSRRCLS